MLSGVLSHFLLLASVNYARDIYNELLALSLSLSLSVFLFLFLLGDVAAAGAIPQVEDYYGPSKIHITLVRKVRLSQMMLCKGFSMMVVHGGVVMGCRVHLFRTECPRKKGALRTRDCDP